MLQINLSLTIPKEVGYALLILFLKVQHWL
jgi:hypothetical protein